MFDLWGKTAKPQRQVALHFCMILSLVILCSRFSWSIDWDTIFPRAPYRLSKISPWKTEAISLGRNTPDICITDNGSLVALERRVSRLSIFPPGGGEPTVLEPKARSQEFPGGLRHFKGCREITAASAEHCLGATAIAALSRL